MPSDSNEAAVAAKEFDERATSNLVLQALSACPFETNQMGLRALVGLMLTGYGLLTVARVIAHDAPLAGFMSLALGILLLVPGLPSIRINSARPVAAGGGILVLLVLGWNLLLGSSLSPPELLLIAYGATLLLVARHLQQKVGRTDVQTLVAWSFPTVLAPLVFWGLNASMTGEAAGAAAAPIVHTLIVSPTAGSLRLIGTPVELTGNSMTLTTPRGSLVLGVGLVCAGIYPMILFMGLLGLHATRERPGWRRFATWCAAGLVGLWVMNILRLAILARVGIARGPAALQTWHANLGWVLFALFMAGFWAVILRPRNSAPRPA